MTTMAGLKNIGDASRVSASEGGPRGPGEAGQVPGERRGPRRPGYPGNCTLSSGSAKPGWPFTREALRRRKSLRERREKTPRGRAEFQRPPVLGRP